MPRDGNTNGNGPNGGEGEQFAAWAKLLAMVAIVIALPLGAWLLNRHAAERRARLGHPAPSRAARLIARGVRQLHDDETGAALASFREAAAADPQGAAAEKLIGITHFLRRNFDPAAAAFRRALDLGDDADLRLWHYLARARRGDAAAADALPEEAPAPLAPLVRLHRGRIAPGYFRAGVARAEGRDDVSRARAWFHLGQFHLLRDDTAAARRAFGRAAAFELDMPEVVVAAKEYARLPAAPPAAPPDAGEEAVLYRGEPMTLDGLMAQRGYVKRGEAWVPRHHRTTPPAEALGEEAPPGKVPYRGLWVTPAQREALAAAGGRPAEGAITAPDDPDAAMRARGLTQYGSIWVTGQQLEAIRAREQQIEAERRRRADRARTNGPVRFDPDLAVWVLDDFDRIRPWRTMAWGNAIRIRPSDGALALSIAPGEHLNSAVRRALSADLTGRDALELDIANTGDAPLKAALALETDAYYETRALRIEPGRRETLRYGLDADTFKSQASGWTHTDRLRAAYALRAVLIVFYTDGPARVACHALRAVRTPEPAWDDPAPYDQPIDALPAEDML